MNDKMSVMNEGTMERARSTGVSGRLLIAVVVASLVLGALVGWFAHSYRTQVDEADAVVSVVNLGEPRLVCLRDSPLGPGDGEGTCGYPYAEDGAVQDYGALVGRRIHVKRLPFSEHGRPVFLISKARS